MTEGWFFLVGKALIAAYFVISGVINLKMWSTLVSRVSAMGFPFPAISLAIAVAVQIGASLFLFVPAYSSIGALVLIAFTIVVSLLFHPYWHMEGAERFLHFNLLLANIAVIGGLLILM